MADNFYEVGLNQNAINQNRQMDRGGSPSWYQDEAFVGSVANGIKGITDYMLQQEKLKGEKSLQQDALNWRTAQENATVNRASTMPLLQRFAKPKKG
ncbi:MAG TPA: hypothetical protein VK149_12370 [Sideroxyarcus sp.]|nr:hypothetical protein [Sideroxyarcus sp.]